MKKLFSNLFLIAVFQYLPAQNLISENFDIFPPSWTITNQSVPVGTNTWGQASLAQSAYFVDGAYNGNFATSYAYVFFQSVASVGDISNWLITPSIDIQNGDVVSFYTRKGLSGGDNIYADRMEVRISTNGDFTTNPSQGATDIGDFTTLALTINPDLNTVDYPTDWTLYSYTVSGLSSATSCKIGFRYYVTNGGNLGLNSDYIAIDAFSVDRPLVTNEFLISNYLVSPNPVVDVIRINNRNNNLIDAIQITDINGRNIKSVTVNEKFCEISLSNLKSGIYILKISSIKGIEILKIVKK